MASKLMEPGIPVDSQGNRTVDPTKNVENLVAAEGVRQGELRAADTKRQDDLREALDLRHTALNNQRDKYEAVIGDLRSEHATSLNSLRDGLGARIDAIKTDYEKRIADILERQSDKSAILLSGTVDKLGATTNERISAVEKNQYVRGGETSVSDPALTERLNDMKATIRQSQMAGDKSEARGAGRTDMGGWIVAGVMLLVAVAGLVFGARIH